MTASHSGTRPSPSHAKTRSISHAGDCPDLASAVFVPYGRAINPIMHTNWEGTGIEPDVLVPAEDALKTAYREALQYIIETTTERRI